jgi:hypothetical protein
MDSLKQLLIPIVREILQEQAPQNLPTMGDLLPAIGSALDEQQQLWLSNNPSKLAAFFLTPEGQAVTRRFYIMYKEFSCK